MTLRVSFIVVLFSTGLTALANKPEPARPPNAGPAATDRPPEKRALSPEEQAAEARHRVHSEQMDASRGADLLRADFEKKYRAGKVPESARPEHLAVVAAFRSAIDIRPAGEQATYLRQRLAGAYVYVGEFDAATRVLTEAVNVATTPAERLQACHSIVLHQCQALKRPDDARPWVARMKALTADFKEPAEAAKWAAVVAQAEAMVEGR